MCARTKPPRNPRQPAKNAPIRPVRTPAGPLGADELKKIDAYWRAANYLSVGQIYLLDNPLLRKPLKLEHIKPRLLGHWGTTPGLNFIYAHLNRVIKAHDLSVIYVTGPGHGGPALVANAYLEGTYSEVYPNVSQDEEGMKRLFTQFSFPGGIPSHVAPETPGSIHEGGELGYALSHAFGAAFDNPGPDRRLRDRRRRGRDRRRWRRAGTRTSSSTRCTTARCCRSCTSTATRSPNPTVLARIPHEELDQLLRGYGYAPHFVEGSDPARMHQQMAAALDAVVAEIQRHPAGRAQQRLHASGRAGR